MTAKQEYLLHLALDIILGILVMLSVVCIQRVYQIVEYNWSSDLRSRTVGLRIFKQGIDPYTYHWQAGQPEEWVDPLDQPEFPRSRMTVTPAVIALFLPTADWNYATVKHVWFILEWVLYVGTALIVMSCTTDRLRQKLIGVVFGVFAVSTIWLSHLYTGQIYIVYTFLLAVAYKLLTISKYRCGVWSGLLTGWNILLRPTIAIVNIPFIAFMKLRIPLLTLLGVVVSFAFTSVIVTPSLWLSYKTSVDVFSKVQYDMMAYYNLPVVKGYTYPIENAIFLEGELAAAISNSALQNIISNNLAWFLDTELVVAGVLVVLMYSGFAFFKTKGQLSEEKLFILGIISALLFEFFVPAPRYMYYNIQWVLPIGLILLHANLKELSRSFAHVLIPLAAIGIVLDNSLGVYFLAYYVVMLSSLILKKKS